MIALPTIAVIITRSVTHSVRMLVAVSTASLVLQQSVMNLHVVVLRARCSTDAYVDIAA